MLENHESSLPSCAACEDVLKETFTSHHLQGSAEDLQMQTQDPIETGTRFVEDVLRLSKHADPQATDKKKLRIQMRGVKNDILGSLVRNPPPTTVEAFVIKARKIECALQARASHY